MIDKRKCSKGKVRNPSTGRCISRKNLNKTQQSTGKKTGSNKSIERLKDMYIDHAIGYGVLYEGKNLTFNSKSVSFLKKNANRIPEYDAPKKDFYRIMYILYDELVSIMHKEYIKKIQHKFKLNVEKYLHGYRIVSKIHEKSAFGSLFFAYPPIKKLHDFKSRSVIKIQSGDIDEGTLLYESYIQRKAHSFGISPKILHEHHKKVGNSLVSIIIMTAISDNLENLLNDIDMSKDEIFNKNTLKSIFNQIIEIIDVFCEKKIIHGDLHLKNIAYIMDKGNVKLKIIDFGQSTYGKPCVRKIELLKMLYGTYFITKSYNRKYLQDALHKYYIKYVGKLNLRDVEKLEEKTWNKYMDTVYYIERDKYLDKINKSYK